MKLRMNSLGLLKTEDGCWSIRRVNNYSWAIQHRTDPEDPWDWQIVCYERTRVNAITRLQKFIDGRGGV